MKFRLGFVSNSSSSSFVVIDFKSKLDTIKDTSFGHYGTTEFGWGPNVCTDIYSKINFAYLQTLYLSKNKEKCPEEEPDCSQYKMLKKVMTQHLGINKISWKLSLEYDQPEYIYGYIDHQSSAEEGRNLEIFDTTKTLLHFLFGKGSKIVLDNDNHR